MSKFKYSKEEKSINAVLNYNDLEIKKIERPSLDKVEKRIIESESILRSLGYEIETDQVPCDLCKNNKGVIIIPSWDNLHDNAKSVNDCKRSLEDLFSEEEIRSNEKAILILKKEYNELHKLDSIDYSICAVAAIVAGAVDILLVGIPAPGKSGVEAGPLSDYIRQKFNEKFSPEEMEKLAKSSKSKVPYDAQDNRNTEEYIAGLSAYYHRLLSLGHDPLLGFVVGVFDIINGTMTTIDKSGKIVAQVMNNYKDRTEVDLFIAIAKQFLHLKSDITTSMGLPAPLMALFNLFQFGSIGEEEQTIAEIVQGMYYEGYDFIHFCSMSIPMMLVEVIVRLSYAAKRVNDGFLLKESIPYSSNRIKLPKLSTMLFISHSGATAINAGKVYFSGNPMAINYPQWMTFAKYSYKQLEWGLINKPNLRNSYVLGVINEEVIDIYNNIDDIFEKISEDCFIVFDGI